jgi:hypothetical protein
MSRAFLLFGNGGVLGSLITDQCGSLLTFPNYDYNSVFIGRTRMVDRRVNLRFPYQTAPLPILFVCVLSVSLVSFC